MNVHQSRHSLQFCVADLAITEAFYAGILDLPVQRSMTIPGAPEHLLLDMNGMALIFVEVADVIKAHPVLEQLLGMFPRGVGVTMHFDVKNIEEINDAILEEGLEVLYPLQLKPYGVKELWCFDPDGYLVVLDELDSLNSASGS